MPKKYFLFLAIIAAVALTTGGCGKKTSQEAFSNPNGQNQNEATGGATVTNPSGSYSVNELLAMNRPMKCSWKESITNGGEVTNIVYVSGKKFYQDVTMGDIGHSFTISDGEYLYIWSDFTATASKIKYDEIKNKNASPTGGANNGGLEQKRNFDCEAWQADESFFTPLTNINFRDVTEEMQGALEDIQVNAEEYTKQACDMCKNAPSQELTNECLKNLACD